MNNNDVFEFEYVDTAISNIMMNDLKKMFDKDLSSNHKLYVNSIIPDEEQKKA